MTYIKVAWHHQLPEEPIVIASELDHTRQEVRKVEVFRGGGMNFACEDEISGDSGLSETQIPEISEINEMPEFSAKEIPKEEFEALWKEAKEQSNHSGHGQARVPLVRRAAAASARDQFGQLRRFWAVAARWNSSWDHLAYDPSRLWLNKIQSQGDLRLPGARISP